EVTGAGPGVVKEAYDAAHQASELPERDRPAVFDRNDIGLIGMKPCGAVDPLSDEVGTSVGCRKIVHLCSAVRLKRPSCARSRTRIKLRMWRRLGGRAVP